MSQQRFSNLVERVSSAKTDDPTALTQVASDIEELEGLLKQLECDELAECLGAAGLLSQHLPHLDGSSASELQSMIARLVGMVAREFQGSGVPERPAQSPAPASQSAAPSAGRHPSQGRKGDTVMRTIQDLLLGELLQEFGFIEKSEIELALAHQEKTGLPLGKIVIDMGFCSERDVEAAAQIRGNAGGPSPASMRGGHGGGSRKGHQPIKGVRRFDEEAMRAKSSKVTNLLLGEILIRAGAVTRDQLEEGLYVKKATGLRIGEALVQIGACTWEQIERAAQVQAQVRDDGTAKPLRQNLRPGQKSLRLDE